MLKYLRTLRKKYWSSRTFGVYILLIMFFNSRITLDTLPFPSMFRFV